MPHATVPPGQVCGAVVELHPSVVDELRLIPGNLPRADPADIADVVRCLLGTGHAGRHHGQARSLPARYPGEVWACWSDGCQPAGLLALPDCPDRHPGDRDEPCLLFHGHRGAHSWALRDPADRVLRTCVESAARQAHCTRPHAGPTLRACRHLHTVQRNGKTHCGCCGKQLYL